MSGLPRAGPSQAGDSGNAMTARPTRVRVLQFALVLTIVFGLLALLMLVHSTPMIFTVFMFVGQPLFVVALIALGGAVVADLRAKELC